MLQPRSTLDTSNGLSDAHAGGSLRSTVIIGLTAAASPLLLLLANSDWFFTREGYLDPWNYVGLFYQYLDPDYLPEDYKLARLPWILSGFAVTRLFAPVTAAYVLHASFLCAGTLALFATIQLLFARPVLAAVVTMCFGFYTHGYGSGGWDYHNTAAMAFYLAAACALALPVTIEGRRIPLIVAGAIAALAVHTNITLANFLPALAFVYVTCVRNRADGMPSVRALFASAAWGLLGAVLATLALGWVNWSVGRTFLFPRILLEIVLRYVADPEKQAAFHQPWSSLWWLTAGHVALPAAVWIAGMVVLARRRGPAANATERVAHALIAQYLAMGFVWVAWQTVGQTALDVDYFAAALIPSCFLACAGILQRGWPDWCERHWPATTLGSVVALTACLVIERLPGAQLVVASTAAFIAVSGCLLFLVPLVLHRWRPSALSVALVIVMFAFGNRVVGGSSNYAATDRCKLQPSIYAAIVESASWLMTDVDPLYTRARIWFDENEIIQPLEACPVRLGHVANSITTMASMPYVARAFPLPGVDALPDGTVAGLASGDRILVIISNTPAHVTIWNRRLSAMGLTYTVLGSHRVSVLASGFTISAWSIGSAPQ